MTNLEYKFVLNLSTLRKTDRYTIYIIWKKKKGERYILYIILLFETSKTYNKTYIFNYPNMIYRKAYRYRYKERKIDIIDIQKYRQRYTERQIDIYRKIDIDIQKDRQRYAERQIEI